MNDTTISHIMSKSKLVFLLMNCYFNKTNLKTFIGNYNLFISKYWWSQLNRKIKNFVHLRQYMMDLKPNLSIILSEIKKNNIYHILLSSSMLFDPRIANIVHGFFLRIAKHSITYSWVVSKPLHRSYLVFLIKQIFK